MSRVGRARERRRRGHLLSGIAALATAVTVVVAAAYFLLTTAPAAIDKSTLCPVEGPKGHVVLLVDRTDPFTFTQRQAFVGLLREFGRGRVRDGELFSVFVVGENVQDTVAPVFELCNPGKGTDKNIWTSNPERIRRQFEERFLKPMTELAGQLASSQAAPSSPIMEMLQIVAIEGFRKHEVSGPRRLVVVSDLMQNTAGYSHYRGDGEFEKFKQTGYFQKTRTDLSGIEVELVYLVNAPERQTRRHAKFWEDYFQELGARVVRIRLLEG